jgi:hypothetical protein
MTLPFPLILHQSSESCTAVRQDTPLALTPTLTLPRPEGHRSPPAIPSARFLGHPQLPGNARIVAGKPDQSP